MKAIFTSPRCNPWASLDNKLNTTAIYQLRHWDF